jgi:hypothetical protein
MATSPPSNKSAKPIDTPTNQGAFNIVEDYDWTFSENKKAFNQSNEQIPYIELIESRIKSSSVEAYLKSIWNSKSDLLQANKDAIRKILGKLADTITGQQQGSAGSKQGSAGSTDPLEPYTELYQVTPTNITYRFPYFSKEFYNAENQFSESYQGNSSWSAEIVKGIETVSSAFENIPALAQPGVYIERPRFYNFLSDPKEISVSFPLLNTLTEGAYSKNLEFIRRFVIMNKPSRKDKILSEPPAIYKVVQPGVAVYPWVFVRNMSVEHIGTKRLMGGDLVPDAFMINITLQPLTREANNYMRADKNVAATEKKGNIMVFVKDK